MSEEAFLKQTALLSHSFVRQGKQNKGREAHSSCLAYFHFIHGLSPFAVLGAFPWGPNHHLQKVSLSPDVFFSAWSLEGICHLVPFFPGHSQHVTVVLYALALPWAFLPWASLKQASLRRTGKVTMKKQLGMRRKLKITEGHVEALLSG